VRDATWSGTASNRVLVALGLACLTVAVVSYIAVSDMILAGAFGFAGLLVVTWSSLVVNISVAGVEVKWGPFGWPVNRVKLADIVDVQAVAIRPLHAGGWGYRGSRALFNRSAALVRRGPAIRLELVRGKIFVITVDDAVDGSTVLQSLLGPSR